MKYVWRSMGQEMWEAETLEAGVHFSSVVFLWAPDPEAYPQEKYEWCIFKNYRYARSGPPTNSLSVAIMYAENLLADMIRMEKVM